MSPEEYWALSLDELRRASLFRDPADTNARELVADKARALGVEPIDATSNDYLGLASTVVSRETLSPLLSHTPPPTPGAGASRLVQGTAPAHTLLERELADWVGLPSALLFATGFAANTGAIASLGGPGTVLVSDALNHASIVDGCRLARAEVRIVPHLERSAIEQVLAETPKASARWVVTESYFSMDGDSPNLPALRALCDRYQAGLIVDEAHALGIFGPHGAGLCAESGVVPDVLIGTLGKAVGAQGAFVAGSSLLRAYLWNRARPFVFSTAPSPVLAALALEQSRLARAADDARLALEERCRQLRDQLAQAGLEVPPGSRGPIVPIVLGDNDRALRVAQGLREVGILLQPIRPPTVPPGSARLRVTVKATFSPADIQRLASSIIAIIRACAA